ncbi:MULTISPECIES: hypothetical protein [unclassified Crossiella]|uniref:hypothetical protein n=1 Tax=unclassified Crossiella TaxID=2620835 RepID=UPI001FFF118A|nr:MULTISPECIES: hypothetical protein [unclassified Crossiella]MCK2240689.1 hypothetical protein [Crossiella sp. S99.2]MCK2252860.1 hypothetical protein [Crossiella sp. S99.1]
MSSPRRRTELLLRLLGRMMRSTQRQPDRVRPTVNVMATWCKHIVLGAAVWTVSAVTRSPAVLHVALYLLITGIAASCLLVNAAAEVRHETRCWVAVLCAGTTAVKLTLAVIAGSGAQGVSEAFGAEFSSTARNLLGGHLPSLFVYAVIAVPFGWSLWLVQKWRLYGRTHRYESLVRHARRQDHFQP